MKTINEMTDQEIYDLTDEQVEKLIVTRCVEEGVRFIDEPPIMKTYDYKPISPSHFFYYLEGLSIAVLDQNDAIKIAKLLSEFDLYRTSYDFVVSNEELCGKLDIINIRHIPMFDTKDEETYKSIKDKNNEIEKEYKEKNKVADASDVNGSKTTTSADSLLVRNWQDILAVYVYQQSQDGKTEFTLDSSCKKDLAKIFAEMNPIVRDKQDITHVTYANRKINYYIKKNKIAKKDRTILKKYVETDCKLLCAVVTAANGFVRESVGDDVSEERVNVISAAYSLVGKVGYFWGGKSTVIGEDPGWGTSEKVSAEGSKSTGTIRAYGLDCSGFVTWAVINGYQDKAMQEAVGDGTSDQWEKANVVTEADAQPGDLVFQKGPEAGSDNHVGILCGKTDAGDWIAVHCSSGKNGVTVGEAYSASFRYIRQPSFYPTQEQVQEMQSSSTVSTTTGDAAASTGTDIFSANVTVSNTLQDAMKSNTSDSTEFTTSESTEKTSILPDKIDLSKEKVAVFKAK